MSTSPNMGLVIPEPLVTTGPTYATQVNTALDVIDAHDHSAGNGVKVTPSGLNINNDLPFNQNSATNLKAVVLSQQAAVTTNSAIYSIGGDLFFRRSNGTQIQITNAVGVNLGNYGNITGLTNPATATYTPASSLFTWLSDVATYAKQATGDILLYAPAGTQAVSLKADVATSAYSLFLPALGPTDNQLMRMKAATAGAFVDLLGTNNQVTVTHNASNITLALPQNIHAAATPTFAGLTLTGTLNGTSAVLSGNVQASGNVSGVNGTFTGDVSGANATLTGDLNLTGNLKSISGALINATLRSLSTSNDISTSTKVTSPLFKAGSNELSTLGLSTTAIVLDSTGYIIGTTLGSGINLVGKFDGAAYVAPYVGQILTATMGGNVNTSTGYQNLISYTLPKGVWEVSANVVFTWNAAQSAALIRKVDTAISLSSGLSDSTSYANLCFIADKAQSAGESQTFTILSRRINIAVDTPVYLVGRSSVSGGGTNNAYFDSLGTILKFQRVG